MKLLLWYYLVRITSGLLFVQNDVNTSANLSASLSEALPREKRTAVGRARCTFFPTKRRIVLVNLNMDYIKTQMFRNWLHFALPHIEDSQLLIDAPDVEVRKYLNHNVSNLPDDTVFIDENFLDEDVVNALYKTSLSDPFNSDGFYDMMRRRPHIIGRLLEAGCEVLQTDLDTAWNRNVFLDVERAGAHELYVTDDNCQNGQTESWYFCGCFVYFKPLRNWTGFIRDWVHQTGHKGNEQDGLNKALKARFKTDKAIDFHVLPFDKFPPGCYSKMHDMPEASMIHANYIKDHLRKINFFKHKALWHP